MVAQPIIGGRSARVVRAAGGHRPGWDDGSGQILQRPLGGLPDDLRRIAVEVVLPDVLAVRGPDRDEHRALGPSLVRTRTADACGGHGHVRVQQPGDPGGHLRWRSTR